MIRQATSLDTPDLVRMGGRFLRETDYGQLIPFDAVALEAFVAQLLEAGVVLVTERHGALTGMLAAQVFQHPMSGELIGCESAWWVEPEHRGGFDAIRLLTAAERWAQTQGAVRFQMVAPKDSPVRSLYERRGYSEVETVYQRPLCEVA